jgi:hypothetical protein
MDPATDPVFIQDHPCGNAEANKLPTRCSRRRNGIERQFWMNILEIQGEIMQGKTSPNPPLIRMRPTWKIRSPIILLP